MKNKTFEMRVIDYLCMTTALALTVERLSQLTGISMEEITEALHQQANLRVASYPPEYATDLIKQYTEDTQSNTSYRIHELP